MTTTTKHEFKAPSQVFEGNASPAIVSPATLVGTWVNTNAQTRDLVKITITSSGNRVSIHPYGACTPSPCDWGAVTGLAYSSSVSASPAIGFTAQFNFGFSQVILVGTLNGNFLTVESFTEFTDSSGRNNYCASMQMTK